MIRYACSAAVAALLFASQASAQSAELLARAESMEVKVANMPFAMGAPKQDEAIYVESFDQTPIALNLYYPKGFDRAAGKAPVIFIESIYSRPNEIMVIPVDLFREAGFVVAVSDSRGMGASGGFQRGIYTANDRRDQAFLVDWLSKRPWSNGKVAAFGLSASANAADQLAASGAPALKAVILRGQDFDLYRHDIYPGGVPNPRILGLGKDLIGGMLAEACRADPAACADYGQPVDGDPDRRLLRAALGERGKGLTPADMAQPDAVAYADDKLGDQTLTMSGGAGYVADLRRRKVPARVGASWMDGSTGASALDRFQALPGVPMEVFISASTHPVGLDADPFATTPFGVSKPDALTQFNGDISFLKRVMDGGKAGRAVNYAVMGTDVWKSTPVWPPAGVRWTRLGFTETGLSAQAGKAGTRAYTVDPAASSGKLNRWASQTGSPMFYGDRREASGKRLSLDAAPVERDMELVGSPELCLVMTTDKTDGLVLAHLEDVAPDGRVTYLAEGLLRLHHRKTDGPACDPAPGVSRSLLRKDGAAVVPGQVMKVDIGFLPTAALIRKGHALRVSLSGADADTFPMLTDAPATWTVSYGAGGSWISLPMKPWAED